MTRNKWERCTNPLEMLGFLAAPRQGWLSRLRHRVVMPSDRKLRLFGVACCRRIWERLPQGGRLEALVPARIELNREAVERAEEVAFALDFNRDAVDLAERYADGLANLKALEDAIPVFDRFGLRNEPLDGDHAFQTWQVLLPNALAAAATAAWTAALGSGRPEATEKEAQAALLRDIIGDPFRAAPCVDRSWLTPEITALAEQAYEHRLLPEGTLDPARLGLLADALEGIGCRQAGILTHLRRPGPHVRGCVAVDAVLGKK